MAKNKRTPNARTKEIKGTDGMKTAHPNIIFATVSLDSGCSVENEEFGVSITGFKNPIDMSQPQNDIELVMECINENIEKLNLKEEAYAEVILKETGECDGHPNWMRYFEITEFKTFSYGE
jgi:hypothetical protein